MTEKVKQNAITSESSEVRDKSPGARKDSTNAGEISEERVTRFLTDNPDWLFGNEDVLQKLNLRSQVHGVNSLLEYQVLALRQDLEGFKQFISNVISDSTYNQRLVDGLLDFCLRLVLIDAVAQLYRLLRDEVPEIFGVEHSQFILAPGNDEPGFRVFDESDQDLVNFWKNISRSKISQLIYASEAQRKLLFLEEHKKVKSIVIIPVTYQGDTRAILALGSQDPKRYSPDKSPFIPSNISRLVTATLQRIRPKPIVDVPLPTTAE